MRRLAISWWNSGAPDVPNWADNTRVEEILMDLSREGVTAARRGAGFQRQILGPVREVGTELVSLMGSGG